jgi:TonB family protein
MWDVTVVAFNQLISRICCRKRSLWRILLLLAFAFCLSLVPLHAQKPAERKPIYKVAPKYPEDLKRHEIGGVVRLSIEITPKGNVSTVSPLGGNPILIEAATEAVRHWRYTPAETSQTVEVKIEFVPRR